MSLFVELRRRNVFRVAIAYIAGSWLLIQVAETRETPDGIVLAVLPFDNLSTDPEMQFFSDGVSEEIIQQLSRGANLKLIGRTSSFQVRESLDEDERTYRSDPLDPMAANVVALARPAGWIARGSSTPHTWV